jgi:hypothetical protein
MPLNTSRAASAASPLWIIALFIALSEVMAGVASIATDGTTRLLFAIFATGFPIGVFAVFVWLLIKHAPNLYSPGQYTETTPIETFKSATAPQVHAMQVHAVAEGLARVVSSETESAAALDGEAYQARIAQSLERILDSASITVEQGLLIDADTAIQEGSDTRGEFAEAAASEKPIAADVVPDEVLAQSELQTWIARYNTVRASQSPGLQRTRAMTSIVDEMMRLASVLGTFDWDASLRSYDEGERLAAYAYLHVNPTCSAADVLVRVLTQLENKPFGQYWALMALRRVLSTCDVDTAERAVRNLSPFGERLRAGTDRRILFDALRRDVENMRKPSR